jgi:hypothetical protein
MALLPDSVLAAVSVLPEIVARATVLVPTVVAPVPKVHPEAKATARPFEVLTQ